MLNIPSIEHVLSNHGIEGVAANLIANDIMDLAEAAAMARHEDAIERHVYGNEPDPTTRNVREGYGDTQADRYGPLEN